MQLHATCTQIEIFILLIRLNNINLNQQQQQKQHTFLDVYSLEYLYNEMTTTKTLEEEAATAIAATPQTAANDKEIVARTSAHQRLKTISLMKNSTAISAETVTMPHVESNVKRKDSKHKLLLPPLIKAMPSQHKQQPQDEPTPQQQQQQQQRQHQHKQSLLCDTIVKIAAPRPAQQHVVAHASKSPLFEVQLQLAGTKIQYEPTFEANMKNNFQQIVEQLLQDIQQTCNHMKAIVADNALSSSASSSSFMPSLEDIKLNASNNSCIQSQASPQPKSADAETASDRVESKMVFEAWLELKHKLANEKNLNANGQRKTLQKRGKLD